MPIICTWKGQYMNILWRIPNAGVHMEALFRRDWMILKAKMLLYTPVVINSALQQRLCAKNMPEHVYCIPHHHQKYQNKKSCSGIFFAHNLCWRAILTTTRV